MRLGRPRSLPALALGALLGGIVPTGVVAQEAQPAPFCDLLTADEVAATLGFTPTISNSAARMCFYSHGDPTQADWIQFYTSASQDRIEDHRAQVEGGSDTEVSGRPAFARTDGRSSILWIQEGDQVRLTFEVMGALDESIDAGAALVQLANIALPRIDERTVPPFTQDAGLESLFPERIGETPLTVQSMGAQDLMAGGDVPQTFLDLLSAHGRSIEDVTVAFTSAYDAESAAMILISAIRVQGVDMPSVADEMRVVLLSEESPDSIQSPGEVAGKVVTIVSPYEDAPEEERQYTYASGDVLWLVVATEPALTEIFTHLP